MSELGGNVENPQSQIHTLDLRVENRGSFLGASIMVPGKMLGAALWGEMLQKTRETGREFGAIVSTNGNKIHTSKIFEGLGERFNYDGNGKQAPSFSPPFLPHGLRSLLPFMIDKVLVHTHPIPAEIGHLPTTVMSAADINAYVNSTYNALVMIDEGGVHILTGRDPYDSVDAINASQIVSDAFEVSKNNTNTIAEVRTKIAQGLVQFGVRYYFTPDKAGSEGGNILLYDCARQAIN
jgi:hypothetical protein